MRHRVPVVLEVIDLGSLRGGCRLLSLMVRFDFALRYVREVEPSYAIIDLLVIRRHVCPGCLRPGTVRIMTNIELRCNALR